MDYWRKLLRHFLAAALTFAACASASATGSKAIYQVIQVSNYGLATVTNVRIEYGDSVIPSGTAHSDIPAKHMVVIGETRMMPIPETATIQWNSSDGKAHVAEVPVRTLTLDTKNFHGFEVSFADNYVTVYRLSRTKEWPRRLDLDRSIVFTSGK